MRWLLLFFLVSLPTASHAAVIISEVAWMGSAASANHEWIELYNDGTATDVTGWILSDGMNLSITLSGTIPAQSYVVLERTSDESAAGAAFLIYTGALVNTGATLTLRRDDGGLEDQVAGGDNWSLIGGDNLTKETAQYTSSGWVTGSPTPARATDGGSPTAPSTNSTASTTPPKPTQTNIVKRSSGGETVRLILPPVSLQLAVDAQKVGYVNQPIPFSVVASGIGKNLIGSLVYEWNFGDGNTAATKNPTHTFAYPGTYAVVVYASYGRQQQLHRHDITILPVDVSVTKNHKGDVQVSNNSPYEIDLSGYTVSGDKTFTFPKFSLLLPNQTITLPKKHVGERGLIVRDATKAVLPIATLSVAPNSAATTKSTEQLSYAAPVSRGKSLPPEAKTAAPFVAGIATTTEAGISPQEIIIGTSSEASREDKPLWPYMAFLGVITLGLFGIARKGIGNQTG